jgi:hypothetical protein
MCKEVAVDYYPRFFIEGLRYIIGHLGQSSQLAPGIRTAFN